MFGVGAATPYPTRQTATKPLDRADAVAPAAFGFIQGQVGVVEPTGGIGVPGLIRRQADAQTGAQGRVLGIGQRVEAIAQRLHHVGGVVERHARQDHTKLIAAVAPGQVRDAQVLAQYFAQLTQHDVAGDVAVGVVDQLEMVDVDQRNRRALMIATAALEFNFQVIFPRAMVEQARQTVGAAQGQQFAFMARQGHGLAIADPAERQRVQH